MESRTYSVKELLKLRGKLPRVDPDTLHVNEEFVDLAKDQDTGKMPLTKEQRSKKTNGHVSSSTESDEIIFRGKNQQRQQWKYRGRTESEVTSNEPVSAPTGLQAQQCEGFQKFFKAVVSPTHVRVTAGGRIVPNTRGSVSPTAKWDKEYSTVGAQSSTEAFKEVKPSSSNGIGSHMTHPLITPQIPGRPGYFQHMGLPMPFLPFHHGIPIAYGIPAPQVASSTKEQATHSRTQPDIEDEEKVFKTQDGAGDKKPRPAPIKIPSQSHLDGNRPYYHNGNVVYPQAYGPGQVPMPMMFASPYLPPGMLGGPAFATAYSASAGPASQLSPMTPVFGPNIIGPIPFVGPPAASGSNQSLQPPLAPMQISHHVTSIRPSEITKRQLESLRGSLKYFKDQLQYNKHQIDEDVVTAHIEKLEQNVQQFEHNYTMQISFEASYYPPVPNLAGSTHRGPSCKTPSGASSVKSRRGADASQNSSVSANDYGHGLSHYQSSERIGSKPRHTRGIGINSNKGIKTMSDVDPHLEKLIQSKAEKLGIVEPSKMGRAHSNVSATSVSNFGMHPSQALQCQVQHFVAQSGPSSGYELGSWQVPSTIPSQQGDWSNAQAFNTYTANDMAQGNVQSSTASISAGNYPQPYLIGTLPQGMQPHNARAMDYVYSRELTEEEKQARYIYWGQVPNGGLGLPKFDGKDFYPPSPVKAARTVEVPPQSTLQRDVIDEPAINYKFLGNDPFHQNRETQGSRSQETGHKVSKAIPIVAPGNAGHDGKSKVVNQARLGTRVDDNVEMLSKMTKNMNVSSLSKSPDDLAAEMKQNSLGRRALERFSNKSGNEFWQTMLKRGATSGTVLPSAVSSTTATGYLPQYQGYAAASLGPTISNTSNSAARISAEVRNKAIECDTQMSAEKIGENRPPNETRSEDYDPVKDVQERMLRDAERRGVIGSDW
ncbi:hypothetical protein K449DRAFT_424531 [Hypoxylon sp. EC38]|nr:hypothetical protein K449DRAFT_424531 [Hypoxylon sp. EC38]